MYKSIWGLVFKYNDSVRQFNSIQFSQEYSNQKNERKKKKNQTRTQYVTEFELKMLTSPEFLTSNNWNWAEILKISFTLVELGPLHKKWAAKPIGNKSDNTLKNMSDNTLKNVSTTAQEMFTRRVDHKGSSLENGDKLDWV
jgi:hypothetical protein